MNPTGYAQAVEEFEVVAGTPGSWVRTRSTVVGLDVLSTSTPRFAYPDSEGDPVPQPDAPLVMVYDAGGSVRDLLADHVAPGDLFTFAGDADGGNDVTPGPFNPVGSQRADYDAFGALILFGLSNTTGLNTRLSQSEAAITGFEQALVSHLTYRGEQYDAHLRMQYLRARHYDQATGRFTRVDPFAGITGEPLTLHKYGYAAHDPVNGMDPTGLFTIPDILGALKTLTSFVATRALAVGPKRALSSFLQTAFVFHYSVTVIHPAQEALEDLAMAVSPISPALAATLRAKRAEWQRDMIESAVNWGVSPLAGVFGGWWTLYSGARMWNTVRKLDDVWSSLASGIAATNSTISLSVTKVPRDPWSVVKDILTYQITPAEDIRLMTRMVQSALRRESRSTLNALRELWIERAPQYFRSATVSVSLPWFGDSGLTWTHQF